MGTLDRAFAAHSPRLSPRGAAVTGWAVQLGVVVLWGALFAQVFLQVGLGAWSVGIAYIAYDTALLLFVIWQTLPMHRRPRLPGTTAEPTVAVLIAAYNEAAVLPATLQGLLAQTSPPDAIIVADDGSTDGTEDVLAAEFHVQPAAIGELSLPTARYPSLRWLRLKRGGKATALNAALLATDADVVITMDADTIPAPDAIAVIRQEFGAAPGLVVAGGVVTPVCGETVGNRAFQYFQTYEYVRNFVARYAWMRVNTLLLISGAFAAFRRDAVLEVGGFDEDCLVEDYVLIHRIQRHSRDNSLGWQVQVVGRAVAETDAPGRTVDFLRQRRRWFGGFLQTQYWNRDMTGNPRYGWLGMVMLPVKAADTMEPIFGLSALVVLIGLLVTGAADAVVPVGAVVLAKLAVDLVALLWLLRVYRRWTGLTETSTGRGALAAALVEPFTFTPLRHAAAVLGWWQFLTGRQTWVPQQRGSATGTG